MRPTSAIRITGYAGFILILAYLFWFLRRVDISLIYYWQQSVPLSFAESLQTPGGICGLFGDRFLELLTRTFTGSMGVAMLVTIVFFSLHVIFRRMKGNSLYFTLLLAALIPFILLFAHYRLPVSLIMSVTAGLVLAAIHGLYSPRNPVAGSLYNLIAGMVVYIIAGPAGLLILLQVIIIRVVLSGSYLQLLSVLPLLIVPALYLPFNLSFTVNRAYLVSFLISEYDEIPVTLYFSLFSPLMLLLVFTGVDMIVSRFTLQRSLLLHGTGIIAVIMVLVFSSPGSINTQERDVLKIFQASFRRDWDQVIRLTSKQSHINQLVQFEVNRALYQTGQLLDSLFLYPQQYGEKGIFLEGNNSSRIAIHMSNFYHDLGFASEVRHWANEAQVVLMWHPVVLRHLVMSYTAMGNHEAAMKYLRILSGSGLYKEWCGQVREMIENNTAREDVTIQSFIVNNPETDFFATTSNPTGKLMSFYRNNPNNHMAFEFLIASYLLQHRIGNVVNLLAVFRNFGCEKLPRAVEEAVLIYLARNREGNISLAGYPISEKTVEEFREFSHLMSGAGSRAEKMKRVSQYRDTYWYYVLLSSPYASKK